MRYTLILAAFGLLTLVGCAPSVDECLDFTAPLNEKVGLLNTSLTVARVENELLTVKVARLTETYETPETLSIDEVSREFTCVYVAAWNTYSSYDETQNRSPGIAYDFAVVPVLEDHGAMVKSFMATNEAEGVVQVVWFPKGALTSNYKETAWFQSREEGERTTPFDGTEPFTCRK